MCGLLLKEENSTGFINKGSTFILCYSGAIMQKCKAYINVYGVSKKNVNITM